MNTSSKDTRFCYGACCTWCGPIQEVSSLPANGRGLPCCPYCQGMLYEMDTSTEWWEEVDNYESGNYPDGKPHPGYGAMWRWQRQQQKCFKNLDDLVLAYHEATGQQVRGYRN